MANNQGLLGSPDEAGSGGGHLSMNRRTVSGPNRPGPVVSRVAAEVATLSSFHPLRRQAIGRSQRPIHEHEVPQLQLEQDPELLVVVPATGHVGVDQLTHTFLAESSRESARPSKAARLLWSLLAPLGSTQGQGLVPKKPRLLLR